MIGFNGLGRNGLLGNQMFQYAALKGIAARHNYEWCIPPNNFRNHSWEHILELSEVFTLNSAKNIQYLPNEYPLVVETDFYFDSGLFSNCPDNINLGGYFQTEKYFKHIEKEIREDFTFKNNIMDPCRRMMNKLGDRVSIHIRRADYMKENEFLGLQYYSKALSHFKNENFIIFSDDTQWCKEQELFSSDRFFVSSFNKFIDLCLMSLCSGHIIANSTFSWWGAWLSNSSTIISPNKWFGRKENDTQDVIPDNWIKI